MAQMQYTVLSWLVLTAVATRATPAAAAAAGAASAALEPLPAPPRGYSTWQWFPGSHWGTGQGRYNAVDEATCMLQAQAMVERGLVTAVSVVMPPFAFGSTCACVFL